MIYLFSLLVFTLDIITKKWAVSSLTFGIQNPVCPLFNLTLVGNRGVSFSMLMANTKLGVLLLIGFALSICGVIIYLIQKEKNSFLRIAYALILGGAIGNIFDRINYGFVIDFLDFYYEEYHFPTFNIADTFICIGVCLLFLKMIKKEKK